MNEKCVLLIRFRVIKLIRNYEWKIKETILTQYTDYVFQLYAESSKEYVIFTTFIYIYIIYNSMHE